MSLNPRNLRPRARRRRRARLDAIEARLRRYGRSFKAPPESKRAGLARVMSEFERAEREQDR